MNFPILYTRSGRNILSLWASKIFESSGIKKIFGANLVAAVVFAGVVTPEATNTLNQLALDNKIHQTPIVAQITTESTYELPLTDFRISQLYSYWHPGIDMTTAGGSPIYSLEAGEIAQVNTSFFGYGKHVIVNHAHGVSTLYAHMSEFKNVFVGKQVERGALIGYVGSTGWSTGNHLHLEIHVNNVSINPLEVLPIKQEEIKYDGIMSQKSEPSIAPLTPTPTSTNLLSTTETPSSPVTPPISN